MFAVDGNRELTSIGREDAHVRTAIYVVCSARPRVGRTLVARLLVEYFLRDRRRVLAYDANPDDPLLTDHLPAHSVPADVSNIRGQMALFDRLIIDDGIPKVIDLTATQFGMFFDLWEKTSFVEESHKRGIVLAVLFVTDEHIRSMLALGDLRSRFKDITMVEVHNEGVRRDHRAAFFKLPRSGAIEMRLPCLTRESVAAIETPGFTFAEYLRDRPLYRTEIDGWIGRAFVAFRDLELRVSLEEFGRLLRQ
jgi:hypothetical protein